MGNKSIGGDTHDVSVEIVVLGDGVETPAKSLWSLKYEGVTYEAERPYPIFITTPKGSSVRQFSLSSCSASDHCCCVVFKGVEWPEKPDMDLEDKVTYAKICVGGKDSVFTDAHIECPLYISTPMGTWKAGTTYELSVKL